MLSSSLSKHGYGRLSFPDGSWFEGYWNDGKAFGQGVFKVSLDEENPEKSSEVLLGEWQQDVSNNLSLFKALPTYELKAKGILKEDLQGGFGMELWNDGSFYKGNYHLG